MSDETCEHVRALREHLAHEGLTVWAEHAEDPPGWVNVYCGRCKRTYETALREVANDDR